MYKNCKCLNSSCNKMNNSNNNYTINPKCKCGYEEDDNGLPENPVLGQSYVPIQSFNETFCPNMALNMGTLFPELVRPYRPNQSICENNAIEVLNSKGECNYGNM